MSVEYLDRIRQLSNDSGTHLYFDTSFLMLLAKLGPLAREQFVTWSENVGSGRFHVPLWSAHEFFKHRLKKTVAAELAGDIAKFDTAAKQLYSSLYTYASDQLFGFADAGTMVLDEFQRTVQPLRAILKMASTSETAASGVQAVSTYIDEHLLPGSLEDLIQDIDVDERVRNRGAVPPAFKDASKRNPARQDNGTDDRGGADNSFGDLVFWREVLRHAKGVRARSVIIITRDRKNDWYENFHGDAGLTPDFRKRVTNALSVPAAHPLLVREAHDFGAGALDLLDPMYCGVLLEDAGTGYARFASAVLRPDLPDPVTGKKYRRWASRFGSGVRVMGGKANTGDADGEAEEDVPFDSDLLTADLLRANQAPDPVAANALAALSEGDLASRANAFLQLDPGALSKWPTVDLVALGRLATELAEQDLPPAIDFITNLRDLGPEIDDQVRLPLYFGALGALHLTRDLRVAPPKGSRVALTLLDMSTTPEMTSATIKVANVLDERGVRHAIGVGQPIPLEVVTISSANNKAPADLIGLKVGGVNLITVTQDDRDLRLSVLLDRPDEAFDTQLGAIIDIVARYQLLPRQLLAPSSDVDAVVRVSEFAGVETDD